MAKTIAGCSAKKELTFGVERTVQCMLGEGHKGMHRWANADCFATWLARRDPAQGQEAQMTCSDCGKPTATQLLWDTHGTDGRGCECPECVAHCFGSKGNCEPVDWQARSLALAADLATANERADRAERDHALIVQAIAEIAGRESSCRADLDACRKQLDEAIRERDEAERRAVRAGEDANGWMWTAHEIAGQRDVALSQLAAVREIVGRLVEMATVLTSERDPERVEDECLRCNAMVSWIGDEPGHYCHACAADAMYALAAGIVDLDAATRQSTGETK